jgi:hypothetical protein
MVYWLLLLVAYCYTITFTLVPGSTTILYFPQCKGAYNILYIYIYMCVCVYILFRSFRHSKGCDSGVEIGADVAIFATGGCGEGRKGKKGGRKE